MKREILCVKCEEKMRNHYYINPMYPGGYVKFVTGNAKKKFICDNCGIDIDAGDGTCVFTKWNDSGVAPYHEHENAYLIVRDCLFEKVKRMCDIVLNETLGNKELESLALYVGHDPRVLNPDEYEILEKSRNKKGGEDE